MRLITNRIRYYRPKRRASFLATANILFGLNSASSPLAQSFGSTVTEFTFLNKAVPGVVLLFSPHPRSAFADVRPTNQSCNQLWSISHCISAKGYPAFQCHCCCYLRRLRTVDSYIGRHPAVQGALHYCDVTRLCLGTRGYTDRAIAHAQSTATNDHKRSRFRQTHSIISLCTCIDTAFVNKMTKTLSQYLPLYHLTVTFRSNANERLLVSTKTSEKRY